MPTLRATNITRRASIFLDLHFDTVVTAFALAIQRTFDVVQLGAKGAYAQRHLYWASQLQEPEAVPVHGNFTATRDTTFSTRVFSAKAHRLSSPRSLRLRPLLCCAGER